MMKEFKHFLNIIYIMMELLTALKSVKKLNPYLLMPTKSSTLNIKDTGTDNVNDNEKIIEQVQDKLMSQEKELERLREKERIGEKEREREREIEKNREKEREMERGREKEKDKDKHSAHFMYHIANEVEQRGMPLEIALLPMIESAYNPVAYSSAHASGIWQFIPSTGKNYGLKQNGWYDGRRDVIAATGAALDYLQTLHRMFNDWELALAAYNWGEGAVQRAIDRNQARGLPTDYLSLAAQMPAETRNYVPKLMAVKNIIANPARYGLTLADVPNEPYFEVITVKRHIDLPLAARFAGMSLDEFKFLNPAHNKPVINADVAETIVLPKHKVAQFMAQMQQHADKPLVSMKTHQVRAGERPEAIATQYSISVAELNNLNGIGGRRQIVTGQNLIVPNHDDLQPTLADMAVPVAFAAARPVYNAAAARRVTINNRGGSQRAAVAPVRFTGHRQAVVIKPGAYKGVHTKPAATKVRTR